MRNGGIPCLGTSGVETRKTSCTRQPAVSRRSSTAFVGSVMTALVELRVPPAKLPGARSQRHRRGLLLIRVCGYWWLRRVNDRWWLRGMSNGRAWCGPRVIPGWIDLLLAIGGEQQYRKDRAKQHCDGCQEPRSSDTFGSARCLRCHWITSVLD